MGIVFIDLKQSFDTVYHSTLYKKLDCCGIRYRELAWFKSYLSSRKQFSRINGVDSEIDNIEVGVPQGSCLGTLLFLISINDLPLALQASKVTMYADDTSLCYQSKDMARLNETITNDLCRLEFWLQSNKRSVGVAKTHVMLATAKSKHNILKQQNAHLEFKLSEHDIHVALQKCTLV